MNKKMMRSALNNNRMLNGIGEMDSRLGTSDSKANHMITDMRSEKRVGARFRHMTMAIALLSLLLLPNLALAQPSATNADCTGCHSDWTTYTMDAAYPDPTIEWGIHYNGNDY